MTGRWGKKRERREREERGRRERGWLASKVGTRTPYLRGRLSTVDLLVLTMLD